MKILCYKNSKLGDYLITLPSIKLIKKKNKKCKIYYLSVKSKFYKDLPKKFEKTDLVNEFIYFNNTFVDKFKLIFYLRKKKFDKFYYLQEKSTLLREFRDFIYFKLLNIKIFKGFFSKKKNYISQNETFQIARRVDKYVTNQEIQNLGSIKNESYIPLFKFDYITISIGGFSQPKIWKLQNWSILLRLILNKFRFKIVIVGTKHDFHKANILSLISKKNIINLCGKSNIDDLLRIIKFSKFHITNDNGSMHLATLFKKKTICLFNNHDPIGKWNPSNRNAIILRSKGGVNLINPYIVYGKLI
tara:strand:+ start:183 stop:1088 length:906 start_codon:yes stop_codon:yes gene_type:complete